MKNEFYTLFGSLSGNHTDSVCVIETKDKEKYLQAKKWALENGYLITHEYSPDQFLDKPDFISTISQ